MCLLRGQIQLRLSSSLQAKESFLEALSLDVRCYDAFQALVGGEMMGVEEGESALRISCFPLLPFRLFARIELISASLSRFSSGSFLLEWDMIQSLCYKEQTEECAEFIKMIYMTRLKKVRPFPSPPPSLIVFSWRRLFPVDRADSDFGVFLQCSTSISTRLPSSVAVSKPNTPLPTTQTCSSLSPIRSTPNTSGTSVMLLHLGTPTPPILSLTTNHPFSFLSPVQLLLLVNC
jgi:hypothetical protein